MKSQDNKRWARLVSLSLVVAVAVWFAGSLGVARAAGNAEEATPTPMADTITTTAPVQTSAVTTTTIVVDFMPVKPAVINTGWLNLRAGPGLAYKVVTKLPFNTAVDLVGRAMNTWVQVRTADNTLGWANRTFLLSYEAMDKLPMVWTGAIISPAPEATLGTASPTGGTTAAFVGGTTTIAAPVGGATHVVQYGETLGSIAALYGTTWPTLAALNGLSNPNFVYAGQVLNVGSTVVGATGGGPSVAAPTTASSGRVHTVQPGETLASIAAVYGTTWPALATLNNLANPNFIYAYQILNVP